LCNSLMHNLLTGPRLGQRTHVLQAPDNVARSRASSTRDLSPVGKAM
jgi:hypothetical protein